MSSPPKGPSRFIPTLTEVVGPSPVQAAVPSSAPSVPLKKHVSEPLPPMAAPAKSAAPLARPVAAAPTRSLPPGFEEYVVHRVMQRVDVGLEQHLREAIATVLQEQTRSLLPRLREEVESVVRHVVYEAVADELAVGETPPKLP